MSAKPQTLKCFPKCHPNPPSNPNPNSLTYMCPATATSGARSRPRPPWARLPNLIAWVAALWVIFVLATWPPSLRRGGLVGRDVEVAGGGGSGEEVVVEVTLEEFCGVGDGAADNTAAFEAAARAIARGGGGRLTVGSGVWLTAPFNLTSRMTLFLAEGAVIRAIADENRWPLLLPLPSYGQGREQNGPRYGSLIHGQYLEDVIITGNNGTIDGQGQVWWTKFQNKQLEHTRPPLVETMWSKGIVISNITLRDSPFWTLHPYDCRNVVISNMTILAPLHGAPNTDGIDPDSCKDMLIENSYISVGDDAIAIKSGWDQYGIAYGQPTTNILIRNVTLQSVVSAGVSIGSEMSGGISNITLENILVWDSRRGVRIKTAPGRGGYIRNISCRNLTFDNLRVGIMFRNYYGEHPDNGYNPSAIPVFENMLFEGIHGKAVRYPVRMHGTVEIPIKGVTFRDMNVSLHRKRKGVFLCSFVQGQAFRPISPEPCESLDVYDDQGRLVRHGAPEVSFNEDYE